MEEIEVGKVYHVNHSRKGKFIMQVTKIDGVFCSGIIISGKTNAMLRENEREVGESISVSLSLCSLTEMN